MNNFTFILLTFSLISNMLLGQTDGSTNQSLGPIICVAELATLRETPDPNGKKIADVHFGEMLEKLGEEIILTGTTDAYWRVETADHLTGWLNKEQCVRDGALAVFLAPARIYIRPQTPSTITTQQFGPGEVVILARTAGEWGQLIAKDRQKAGWVRTLEFISIESIDIELATLMNATLTEKNLAQKRRQWTALFREAKEEQAEMYEVLLAFYEAEYPGEAPPSSSSMVRSRTIPSASPAPNPPPRPAVTVRTERFFDQGSNKWYTQTRESGPVQVMSNLSHSGESYLVAHKSLKKGTKILLEIPGNQGYIEAKVEMKLKQDVPEILGISPQAVRLLYGDIPPNEITVYYLVE
ncbi:MAG: SH3 domain-containing protein [Bacteroidota bacterium]